MVYMYSADIRLKRKIKKLENIIKKLLEKEELDEEEKKIVGEIKSKRI